MLNKRISRFFLGGFFFSHLLSAVYPSHSFCTKGLCSELKRIYSLQEEGDSEVKILKDHEHNYPISNGSYRPMSPNVVPASYGRVIAYPINDYRYDDMGRKYYDYQQQAPYNASMSSRIYLNDIVTYYSGVFKEILR